VVYDPANITVVGIVKLPRAATLQEARQAQAAMPPPRGRAAKTGWFLRPAPRAPRVPPRQPGAAAAAAVRADYKKK
jgi:hypothetical protein